MSLRPTHFITLFVALAASSPVAAQEVDSMRLFDFSDARAVDAWRPVHDGVMGGVSSGRARAVDGAARFGGELSLDNNGGFASFRIGERLPDLTDFDGLRVRVRGDGQVYKLSLRADGEWQGVSWQASFATVADEWVEADLAFEDFAPTWRGRLVTEAPPLDVSQLVQLGVSIADKQDGPYAFEVATIDAWKGDDERRPGSRAAERERTAALASALDAGVNADGLATMLRWDERLLVISSPSELDAISSAQCSSTALERAAMASRDLRMVQLFASRGGRIAGRTLTRAQIDALRDRWSLDPGRWSVALVGKDGGVKQRWSSPVGLDEVFAQIDVMPMRRSEASERAPAD